VSIQMSTSKALKPAQDMSIGDLRNLIEYILDRLTETGGANPVCDLSEEYHRQPWRPCTWGSAGRATLFRFPFALGEYGGQIP